jgi:hypothetical protein
MEIVDRPSIFPGQIDGNHHDCRGKDQRRFLRPGGGIAPAGEGCRHAGKLRYETRVFLAGSTIRIVEADPRLAGAGGWSATQAGAFAHQLCENCAAEILDVPGRQD